MSEEIRGTYIPRKKLKIVGFVQARMDSGRLWGKSMMPLGPGGYPVALHCYWRLKRACPQVEEVWFMPTDRPADQEIIDLAKSLHEPYIVRPEGGWSLAAAYVQLHEAAKADVYLMVEADSPLADWRNTQVILPYYLAGKPWVQCAPPSGIDPTTPPTAKGAGAIGIQPAWMMTLQKELAGDDRYLNETPGAIFTMKPEAYEIVAERGYAPTFVECSVEEYGLYRPWHQSLEEASDAIVFQIIYANLWRGPGPENCIDLHDVIRWTDQHPEVLRYNAHVVDSVACQKSRDAEKRNAEEIARHMALYHALATPGATIQRCERCNAFIGHVHEEAGHHWFVLVNGVRIKGRADVKCGRCGAIRRWFEDR